jgi:HD-GYP domain-containing protein (c-di-GMP phosphodiesterase class II)
VADAYDAMTSARPYRLALGHDAAMRELKRCAGSQFDPEIVRALVKADEIGKLARSTRAAAPGLRLVPVPRAAGDA